MLEEVPLPGQKIIRSFLNKNEHLWKIQLNKNLVELFNENPETITSIPVSPLVSNLLTETSFENRFSFSSRIPFWKAI